jgi:hypothetical protein
MFILPFKFSAQWHIKLWVSLQFIFPLIKTDIKIELGSLTVSVSWQKWRQGHSSPVVEACNTQ